MGESRILPRVLDLLTWQAEHGTKQKSEEWLRARRRCVTASDVPSVLGENPYRQAPRVLLDKLGITPAFSGNEATRHGEQFEPEAIRLYEAQTGRRVLEFGLLPHPLLDGLAGSPDGITEDGVLIEVKVRLLTYAFLYPQ